jgi:hypothetical protein
MTSFLDEFQSSSEEVHQTGLWLAILRLGPVPYVRQTIALRYCGKVQGKGIGLRCSSIAGWATVVHHSVGIGVLCQHTTRVNNPDQRTGQILDLEVLETNGMRLAAGRRSPKAYGGELHDSYGEVYQALVNEKNVAYF